MCTATQEGGVKGWKVKVRGSLLEEKKTPLPARTPPDFFDYPAE